MGESRDVAVIRQDQVRALLGRGERRELLTALATPGSAASLSRQFGVPRQRLNYHLRALEKAGLVELVEERRKGNCVERVLRATARAYVLNPELPLALDPAEIADRFSSTYLLAVTARALNDLVRLREAAQRNGRKLPTLALQAKVRFRDPAARQRFTEELTQTLAALIERHHDASAPEGRLHELFVGGYPAITRNLDESAPGAAQEEHDDE